MGIPDNDEFLALIAERFQLLGDATRLAILRALMGGELSVNEISEQINQKQANVSKHLKLLHDAGLVRRRKQGILVFYQITDPMIDGMCKLACEAVARTAEAEIKLHSERIELFRRPPAK